MSTTAARSWLVSLAVVLLGWAPGPQASAQDLPFTHVVIAGVPPNGPDTKTVGDIDGDGFPDVIVASSTFEGMYWYRYPRLDALHHPPGRRLDDRHAGR